MKLAWIGLGKLGTPAAVTFAEAGHDVVGYDLAPKTLSHPNLWVAPTIAEACDGAEVVFVAVQTPHPPGYGGEIPAPLEPKGFDTSHLRAAVEQVAAATDAVVAVVSTVLPGTCRTELTPLVRGPLVYHPFFIAMGTVEADIRHPEFVLLGSDDERAAATVARVYDPIHRARRLHVSVESAELVKVAYNCHVSLKVLVANALMEISEKTGADCDEISGVLALATDRIVSSRYMRGGMGDGGPCLLPGEFVMTEHGPRAIESIRTGDRVLGSDGRLHRVLRTWNREYSGSCVELKIMGQPPLRVTADHPIPVRPDIRATYQTRSRGKPIVKRHTHIPMSAALGRVEKLPAGHLIAAHHWLAWPIPMDAFDLVPEHVTVDYCHLAGWYLSEGSLDLNWANSGALRSGRVTFDLNDQLTNVAEDLARLCERLAPPKSRGRGAGAHATIQHRVEQHGLRIRYGSVRLASWLYADFGKRAEAKRFPSWLLWGDLKLAADVLKGLYGGDGHSALRCMNLATSSPDIAWGTQMLLARLGISAHIRCIPSRSGGGVKHRLRCYEVQVANADDIAKLAEVVGMRHRHSLQEKRYVRVVRDENTIWRALRCSTSFQYSGPVHNLWVEGTNDYVTAAGVVYNCHPRDGIAMQELARTLDLSADVFGFTVRAREAQTRWLAELVAKEAASRGLPVVVMGRSYKVGVDIEDGSSALLLGWYLADCDTLPIQVDDPALVPELTAVYVIAKQDREYTRHRFPTGSVVVDPWGIMPDRPGVHVHRIGRQ